MEGTVTALYKNLIWEINSIESYLEDIQESLDMNDGEYDKEYQYRMQILHDRCVALKQSLEFEYPYDIEAE